MATGKPDRDLVLIAEAIEAFLASPRCAGSGNTYRAYAGVLSRLAGQLGARRTLADVDDEEIGAALKKLWGTAAPATWNRNRGHHRLLAGLVPEQVPLARADCPGRL